MEIVIALGVGGILGFVGCLWWCQDAIETAHDLAAQGRREVARARQLLAQKRTGE